MSQNIQSESTRSSDKTTPSTTASNHADLLRQMTELEIKHSFMEAHIDSLSEQLNTQEREMRQMRQTMQAMTTLLRKANAAGIFDDASTTQAQIDGLIDEKPPHY